eukprot:scaffold1407_cov379-Pavlova_lutheri.AAC.1
MSCHLFGTVQPPRAHPSQLRIGTGSAGSLRSVSIKVPGSPYKKPVLIEVTVLPYASGKTGSDPGLIRPLHSNGVSYPLLAG